LDENTANDIATAAEKAWTAVLTDLQGGKGRVNGIDFYPNGINDIEVTAGIGPVKIIIKVSGPASKPSQAERT